MTEKKQACNQANGGPIDHSGIRSLSLTRFRSFFAFAVFCIGLLALLNMMPPFIMRPVNEQTAHMLGLFLHGLGVPALVTGDVVQEQSLAFRIIPECTPLFTVGIFFCFTVFYPASLKQKALGLVCAVPLLIFGNILRLTATFLVSMNKAAFFDATHVYLGQIFTLFLLMLCCVLWIRWVEQEHAGARASVGGKMGRDVNQFGICSFFVQFGLISAILFLAWVPGHHVYIRLLDGLMVFGFSVFGRTARLAHETPLYYETFSLVVTASLILAAHFVPWQKRVRVGAAGLGFLLLIHLLHRVDNALIAVFHIRVIEPLDFIALLVGQYVVPVLLLYMLLLERQTLLEKESSS